MPMRRARRSLVYAAVLPLLLASGCGGDDDDPEPIVTEPPPSASPSPSASPAAQREPWERRTKAGAVAFVEHWVEVFNEAGATGEVAELQSISDMACVSCQQLIERISKLYEEGARVESDGWQVLVTQPVQSQRRDPFDVAVRIKRPRQRVVDASGQTERFPGSTETYSVLVSWQGDRWRMSKFNQIA